MTDDKQQASFRWRWLQAVRAAGLGGSDGNRGGRGSVPAVALALGTYGNADGTRVHPGQERLAAGLGISRSSVTRALDELRERGLIVEVRPASYAAGRATEYRLALPDDLVSFVDDLASPSGDLASSGDVILRHLGARNDAPQSKDRVSNTQGSYTEFSTQETLSTGNPWAGLDDSEETRQRQERWAAYQAAQRAAAEVKVVADPWAEPDDDEVEVESQPLERIELGRG